MVEQVQQPHPSAPLACRLFRTTSSKAGTKHAKPITATQVGGAHSPDLRCWRGACSGPRPAGHTNQLAEPSTERRNPPAPLACGLFRTTPSRPPPCSSTGCSPPSRISWVTMCCGSDAEKAERSSWQQIEAKPDLVGDDVLQRGRHGSASNTMLRGQHRQQGGRNPNF